MLKNEFISSLLLFKANFVYQRANCHSVSKLHVSPRSLTTSFPGPSPGTTRRELWVQGWVFRVQNLNAPSQVHCCISLLRRGVFVSQGDGGPPRTYGRLLHFDYCYVFLGGGYPAEASAEERDVLFIRTAVDINYSLLGRVEASLFH